MLQLSQTRSIAQSAFAVNIPAEVRDSVHELIGCLRLHSYTQIPEIYNSTDLSAYSVPEPTARSSRFSGSCRSDGGSCRSNSGSCRSDNRRRSTESSTTENSTQEWSGLRSFQATQITSSGGVAGITDAIRAQWNKTTDKTYDVSKEKIFELVQQAEDSKHSDDHVRLAQTVLDIASNTPLYSRLYAELYATLIGRHAFLLPPLESTFERYKELYENFEYHSDSDYAAFCEMNKCNDKRRAMSKFIMNLGLVYEPARDVAKTILRYLVQTVVSNRMNSEQRALVDEYTENIAQMFESHLVTEGGIYMNDGEDAITISAAVQALSELTAKKNPGLSNKSIFKFMDLTEAFQRQR